METKVLIGHSINFHKLSNLLIASFSFNEDSDLQIQEKSKAMSEQFLRHKYCDGIREGKLAVIIEHDEYIACNGMLFIPLYGPDSKIDGWMSCDTATDPKFRGKGLFRACISALEAALTDDCIFFGYPNAISSKSFTKLGWKKKHSYALQIRLVTPMFNKKITNCVDAFYKPMPELGQEYGVEKTNKYLNWRYHETRAEYFKCISVNNTFAFVARRLTVHKIPVLLLLEVFANSPKAYRDSLKAINYLAWKRHCLIIASSPGKKVSKKPLLQLGVKIPTRLSGRRIELMGQSFGVNSGKIWDSAWNTSLGDWDAF